MSDPNDTTKYDEVFTSILVNEKSILGFLSAIFNFLARRTDFYYVPEGPYENMGFPPGVAEELVVKVLRTCDPKNWKAPNGARKPHDVNNEIMCSTVAQEVEVIADEENEGFEGYSTTEGSGMHNYTTASSDTISTQVSDATTTQVSDTTPTPVSDTSLPCSASSELNQASSSEQSNPDDYQPPFIPMQKNSDTYNGAERENYCWSQTIMELEVIVKLPPTVKSSKDLRVTINPTDISVASHSGDVIIKDTLPFKIKALDSFWSISEGRLLIHLEKAQERWWDRLLQSEEPIDLSKIDCSRPMDELPEDHIAKVRELQWNQEQKMKGLPTSDQIRNIDILKKAWNAKGSPFKGQEFDPSVLNQ